MTYHESRSQGPGIHENRFRNYTGLDKILPTGGLVPNRRKYSTRTELAELWGGGVRDDVDSSRVPPLTRTVMSIWFLALSGNPLRSVRSRQLALLHSPRPSGLNVHMNRVGHLSPENNQADLSIWCSLKTTGRDQPEKYERCGLRGQAPVSVTRWSLRWTDRPYSVNENRGRFTNHPNSRRGVLP